MILDSLLSHSPILLFLMSALLLVAYGTARAVRAGVRGIRRVFAHAGDDGVARPSPDASAKRFAQP